MTGIKSSIKLTALLLTLPLAGIMAMTLEALLPQASRVQAQLNPQSSNHSLITNWDAYEPDSSLGKPGRREGGGSRGPCIKNAVNDKVLPLVPRNIFGTTMAEYPTFLIYLPPLSEDYEPQMKFVLKGDNEQEIYTTQSAIGRDRGIISISLPASSNVPPLQTGKTYQWSFTLICNTEDPSGNSLAEGLIQRIEPNTTLKQQLQQAASPRDKVIVYAAAGIWYDALSILAQVHRLQPEDPQLKKDWADLLQSVNLEKIATEPLLAPIAASNQAPNN